MPLEDQHREAERGAQEITTVPTITIEATRARVMISITMKISVSAAKAAIMVSYFAPDWMSR